MNEENKQARLVERLAEILEGDVENLRRMLARLDGIRCAVIKRDDAALAGILDEIHGEQNGQQMRQNARQQLRMELGRYYGVSTEQITLGFLLKMVNDSDKKMLAEKRKQLKKLSDDLKREYAAAVFLLGQCAKINKQLLDAIFNRNKGSGIIYDSGGAAQKDGIPAFVNMKL